MGYCFFNNVAVAAKIAQQRWNVQRYLLKRNWAMGCWINLLCYAGNDWVNCHKCALNKMLYFSNMWPETLSCLSSISGLAMMYFMWIFKENFSNERWSSPSDLKVLSTSWMTKQSFFVILWNIPIHMPAFHWFTSKPFWLVIRFKMSPHKHIFQHSIVQANRLLNYFE